MSGEEREAVSRISSIIESVLLVSPGPVKEEKLRKITGPHGQKAFEEAITHLLRKYGGDSGILVERIAGGFQLRTNPANQDFVRQFLESRPPRLTRASLETVSIIAYKQPVTRSEIEDIRGVDSQGAIRTLLDRRFIRVVGKKDVPGRPFLFSTTKEFLEVFGLESLTDLPSISELSEILGGNEEVPLESESSGSPESDGFEEYGENSD